MTTGWQEITHGTHYRQDDGAIIVKSDHGQGNIEYIARHPKGPVKNYRRSGMPRFNTLNQAKKAINEQYPFPGSEPVFRIETLKSRELAGAPQFRIDPVHPNPPASKPAQSISSKLLLRPELAEEVFRLLMVGLA